MRCRPHEATGGQMQQAIYYGHNHTARRIAKQHRASTFGTENEARSSRNLRQSKLMRTAGAGLYDHSCVTRKHEFRWQLTNVCSNENDRQVDIRDFLQAPFTGRVETQVPFRIARRRASWWDRMKETTKLLAWTPSLSGVKDNAIIKMHSAERVATSECALPILLIF